MQGRFKAKHYRINAEAGITLTGLIFVLALIALVATVGIKVTPAWLEFRAVKQSLAKAKSTGGTPQEMRTTFDKNADINMIDAVQGRDLVFSRNDDGTNEISVRYERKVALVGNASLVFDFADTTDPKGVVAEAEPAAK